MTTTQSNSILDNPQRATYELVQRMVAAGQIASVETVATAFEVLVGPEFSAPETMQEVVGSYFESWEVRDLAVLDEQKQIILSLMPPKRKQ